MSTTAPPAQPDADIAALRADRLPWLFRDRRAAIGAACAGAFRPGLRHHRGRHRCRPVRGHDAADPADRRRIGRPARHQDRRADRAVRHGVHRGGLSAVHRAAAGSGAGHADPGPAGAGAGRQPVHHRHHGLGGRHGGAAACRAGNGLDRHRHVWRAGRGRTGWRPDRQFWRLCRRCRGGADHAPAGCARGADAAWHCPGATPARAVPGRGSPHLAARAEPGAGLQRFRHDRGLPGAALCGNGLVRRGAGADRIRCRLYHRAIAVRWPSRSAGRGADGADLADGGGSGPAGDRRRDVAARRRWRAPR